MLFGTKYLNIYILATNQNAMEYAHKKNGSCKSTEAITSGTPTILVTTITS